MQEGEPGEHLFQLINEKSVVPIAWGENGFRELIRTRSTQSAARKISKDGKSAWSGYKSSLRSFKRSVRIRSA